MEGIWIGGKTRKQNGHYQSSTDSAPPPEEKYISAKYRGFISILSAIGDTIDLPSDDEKHLGFPTMMISSLPHKRQTFTSTFESKPFTIEALDMTYFESLKPKIVKKYDILGNRTLGYIKLQDKWETAESDWAQRKYQCLPVFDLLMYFEEEGGSGEPDFQIYYDFEKELSYIRDVSSVEVPASNPYIKSRVTTPYAQYLGLSFFSTFIYDGQISPDGKKTELIEREIPFLSAQTGLKKIADKIPGEIFYPSLWSPTLWDKKAVVQKSTPGYTWNYQKIDLGGNYFLEIKLKRLRRYIHER